MNSNGKTAVERATIGGDRRQDRRYHLQMELSWKLILRRRVLDTGIGHTIDLSGGGILFDAGRPLPTGHDVVLSISWPVLFDGKVPMQLAAKGRIVRENFGQVAIQMVQREVLAAPTPIDIQSYTATALNSNQTYLDLRDGTISSQEFCALGRVFTQDEPLDYCAALADQRDARFSELLAALRESKVECSSRLDAIAFGEPRTNFGSGVIREVVEPKFAIHS
jgi:hypothetical protein